MSALLDYNNVRKDKGQGKFVMGNVKRKPHHTFYEMSDIMERMIAQNSVNVPVDYGTGEKYNHVEVHVLSHVVDNPGISVTEVAQNWNRTKGAVSQIVKKLVQSGMIYKGKKEGNDKTLCLYATPKGQALDIKHREYDSRNYRNFIELMKKEVPEKDIYVMFQVMEVWTRLSMEWIPE